jgi:molecular chaperone DnaK
MAADNTSLGRFTLDGIPPARRGVPQIEVTFDIDANGIINVSAKDLGTGKEQKITIASSNKLSKEEIDAAIKNAEQFAEADKKKEELINARNQAETIVYTTKKTLDELGDKVTQEERTTVENAIKDLEAVQNSDNIDDIKAKTDAVMKAVEPISEKIYKNATPEQQQAAQQAYEQAQQQAQGNQSAGSSKKADDDNVIDADYKIVDDDDKN